MRCSRLVAPAAVCAMLTLAYGPARAEQRPAEEIRPRVEHHLRAADDLAQHFGTVLTAECPKFDSRDAWRAYFDGEIDRVVLMMAHLEQAWTEAKRTGDDDVRRAAKAPRRRVDEARTLVGKLQQCANGYGTSFSPSAVWRRIERDVPLRQSDVALPQ
ncbi:MAG: hypothetical protein ACRELS_06750 [Candidatus Rokuibacteriota bacterium]